MFEMDVFLPRSAFSPRETARPGDLWRAFQDVAVGGSISAGWDPERYRREGVSFVVRSMVVLHHRETVYGERLRGRTWPSGFRRAMLFRRECRIVDPDDAPVVSATQDWVHVSAELSLVRASDELVESFPPEEHGDPVEMPSFEPVEDGRTHVFDFECWDTWMDPLGHVNHPRYVDWADEATSRAMRSAGLDPLRLRSVAESVQYKTGVTTGERVTIASQVIGQTEQAVAIRHQVAVGDRAAARIVTLRSLVGEVAEEEGTSSLLELC